MRRPQSVDGRSSYETTFYAPMSRLFVTPLYFLASAAADNRRRDGRERNISFEIDFGVGTRSPHATPVSMTRKPVSRHPDLTRNYIVAYTRQVTARSMDRAFKALADPSRRELLDALYRENGQTLGGLCAHLDMTRQAVSKHLALLEEANLVAIAWRGREKLHYLNPVPIADIAERWIGKFERQRLRALRDLKSVLEEDASDE